MTFLYASLSGGHIPFFGLKRSDAIGVMCVSLFTYVGRLREVGSSGSESLIISIIPIILFLAYIGAGLFYVYSEFAEI